MRVIRNLKPIVSFIYSKRRDFFSNVFWRQQVPGILQELFALNRVNKKTFKENLEIFSQRPATLQIELTNLCNANCIFCAYQYQTRPHSFMSDKVYYKALNDYCAIGGGALMLEVIVGDPLLDKNFIRRVKEARAYPEITTISTITNCIALREEEAIDIINSGINIITISTSPWRKDLYERIYRNPNYNRMRKNVFRLLEENYKAGCPVDIVMGFRSNLSIKKTLSLPDYQELKKFPHKVQFNATFDTWGGRIKNVDLLPGMHLRPKLDIKNEACFQLYSGAVVLANGDVCLCGCRDVNADSELVVGNILEESLINIWRSEKIKELRSGFSTGKYPDICRDCTMYCNLNLFRTKKGTQNAKQTALRFESTKLKTPGL